ncbi:MAG: hypothetical protein K6E75_07515 [Lachnospiraceae bacterium]|nr:hypothetical protein [Lachnospiraceae bacterium]
MSRNGNRILKASYVNVEQENVHVIDADALFLEKVGELPPEQPDSNDPIAKYGFDPYGDGEPSQAEEDPSVSALFGEMPKGDPFSDDFGAEQAPDPDRTVTVGAGDSFSGNGFSSGLTAEVVDHATMGTGVSEEIIQRASDEADALISQAQDQAQQLVAQAMAEAERQAGELLEQARAQGHAEGYEAGQAEAQQIAEQAKREYAEKKMELQREYDEKLRLMEPHLVEELTGIYEQIFTVDLSGYRNIINHMITNTMHALESSGTYLIHVSPADYSALSMQKTQLRNDCNIPEAATMELVEDIALTKNQCLIETDDGIYDCSLTVQLEELRKKLMLLAYEGARRQS